MGEVLENPAKQKHVHVENGQRCRLWVYVLCTQCTNRKYAFKATHRIHSCGSSDARFRCVGLLPETWMRV